VVVRVDCYAIEGPASGERADRADTDAAGEPIDPLSSGPHLPFEAKNNLAGGLPVGARKDWSVQHEEEETGEE
jgi:hypothetical protein